MHHLDFPHDLNSLTDKDLDRWNEVVDYFEWWLNNRRFGGHHFSTSPATPIVRGQVQDGEIGTEQVDLYAMTATQLAATIADEEHFYDESVLHEAIDFADARFIRDGAPGFGVISGVSSGQIASGQDETIIEVFYSDHGDVSAKKAIVLPVRPVLVLAVSGATFATDPVDLYSYDFTTVGFKVLAVAGEALGSTFPFDVHWTVRTRVLP